MIPELTPFLQTSTPHQREDVLAPTDLTCIGTLYKADLQRYQARTHYTPTMNESVILTIRLPWPPSLDRYQEPSHYSIV
ncbi:hypothetical protein TNCV_1525441 [Trichonephila clavipes]|nr:hypothetical protein TNCV_1525441 [Trichonephila clavipes]